MVQSKSGNELRLSEGEQRSIEKVFGRKSSGWKAWKYRFLAQLGREIPVEYRSPGQRCRFEADCLRLWSERGFAVPTLIRESDRRLLLSRLSGPTLQIYLQDSKVSLADKLKLLHGLFLDMRKRHCFAIYEGEHRLVHFDANLRNILICEGVPIRLDFEMGHLQEKIDRSAAREVQKLVLEICRILGTQHQGVVLDLLAESYGIRHILRRVADEELNRPLQALHERRDRKKKAQTPGLTTKRDVARGLRRRVGTSRLEKKGVNHSSDQLKDAVGSSWDGKLYQSLSDHDPRGRDMPHRYSVMQFPSDLKGKTVLDIGCNVGRICLDAMRRGARRAVGIDYRADVMDAMNLFSEKEHNGAEFYCCDVNQGVEAVQEKVGYRSFDIVCALAIWSHVDQQKLWDLINACNATECYFEDNAPSRVKSLQKVEDTLRRHLHFDEVTFLGFTTDRGIRSVFRLRNTKNL